MPNSFLPPIEQGGPHSKEGVILLGDAWNMRHPLTGGGMTVALSDVVLLAPMIAAELDLTDWHAITEVLHRWHWARKPLAATINILSVALYDLFSAEGAYSMSHLTVATRYHNSSRLTLVLQTNTSPFYGLGASSISSAAVNASEFRFRYSQGEFLSIYHGRVCLPSTNSPSPNVNKPDSPRTLSCSSQVSFL